MTHDDVSLLTATAVFIGAAILVGAPVTFLVAGLVAALVDAVGVSLNFGTGLVGTVVALGVAVLFFWLWAQISYEAAQLQLSEPSITVVAGLTLAVATLGVLVRAGRAFRDELADNRPSR